MKTVVLILILLIISKVYAVQTKVRCRENGILISRSPKNTILGAYVCSKFIRYPLQIYVDENKNSIIDEEDSVSFYVSKTFTLYNKMLQESNEFFEEELQNYYESSGETDTFYQIDIRELKKRPDLTYINQLIARTPHELHDNQKEEVQDPDVIIDEEEYFARQRYYNAGSNRFLTPDPKGFVDGPNPYKYARNNPLIYVDPTGNSSVRNLTSRPVVVSGNRGLIRGSGPQVQITIRPGETVNIFNPKDGVRDVDAVDLNNDGVADINTEKISGTSFWPFVDIVEEKGNRVCK